MNEMILSVGTHTNPSFCVEFDCYSRVFPSTPVYSHSLKTCLFRSNGLPLGVSERVNESKKTDTRMCFAHLTSHSIWCVNNYYLFHKLGTEHMLRLTMGIGKYSRTFRNLRKMFSTEPQTQAYFHIGGRKILRNQEEQLKCYLMTFWVFFQSSLTKKQVSLIYW